MSKAPTTGTSSRPISRARISPFATAAGRFRWMVRGSVLRSTRLHSRRSPSRAGRFGMTAPACDVRSFTATDGYPLHIAVWGVDGPARGQIVVVHGVQSHSGWYHRLGQTLASSGYIAAFPDRR